MKFEAYLTLHQKNVCTYDLCQHIPSNCISLYPKILKRCWGFNHTFNITWGISVSISFLFFWLWVKKGVFYFWLCFLPKLVFLLSSEGLFSLSYLLLVTWGESLLLSVVSQRSCKEKAKTVSFLCFFIEQKKMAGKIFHNCRKSMGFPWTRAGFVSSNMLTGFVAIFVFVAYLNRTGHIIFFLTSCPGLQISVAALKVFVCQTSVVFFQPFFPSCVDNGHWSLWSCWSWSANAAVAVPVLHPDSAGSWKEVILFAMLCYLGAVCLWGDTSYLAVLENILVLENFV